MYEEIEAEKLEQTKVRNRQLLRLQQQHARLDDLTTKARRLVDKQEKFAQTRREVEVEVGRVDELMKFSMLVGS